MYRWFLGVFLMALMMGQPAHAVTLLWEYTQGSDPAVQFNLYKQPGCAGAATIVQTQNAPAGTTTSSAVVENADACYFVTAQDGPGKESAPSNSVHVQAVTILNAPTNLRQSR